MQKNLQEVITLTVFVPFAVFLYERGTSAGLSLGGALHPRSSFFPTEDVRYVKINYNPFYTARRQTNGEVIL